MTRRTEEHQDRAYRPWQVRIFAATWLAYAGYYFCRKAFYVTKANLGADLHISTMQLANLGTAYLLAYMVGQFSSAFFGRWLGPKKLLLVGMGASITANLVFGFSNAYHTVLEFMLLNGLAQGTGWPGCIGSLAFWFRRRERGTVLGFWSTCYQVGSFAASALAAFLLGEFGWRWSFFGAAMVLSLVWLVVLALHPNRPQDVGLDPLEEETEDETEEETTDRGAEQASRGGERAGDRGDHAGHHVGAGQGDGAPGVPGPTSAFGRWMADLGWNGEILGTIVLMGSIYFSIKFLRYTLWSWVPFFLQRNFHQAGDLSGYLSISFDVAGTLGVLAAGYASDKFFRGHRAGLAFGLMVLMAGGFVLLYLVGTAGTGFFVGSLALIGFALFGPDSLLSGVGAIDVGSKKGALVAAGIINGMGSAGPILQERLVAFVYERSGDSVTPVFALLVGVALAGTLLTGILWLRARKGKAAL